jgi:hypothetical protein
VLLGECRADEVRHVRSPLGPEWECNGERIRCRFFGGLTNRETRETRRPIVRAESRYNPPYNPQKETRQDSAKETARRSAREILRIGRASRIAVVVNRLQST